MFNFLKKLWRFSKVLFGDLIEYGDLNGFSNLIFAAKPNNHDDSNRRLEIPILAPRTLTTGFGRLAAGMGYRFGRKDYAMACLIILQLVASPYFYLLY